MLDGFNMVVGDQWYVMWEYIFDLNGIWMCDEVWSVFYLNGKIGFFGGKLDGIGFFIEYFL